MNDTHATPSEKTANLMALQRELADLAARAKQADRPRLGRAQVPGGTVLVIRGK